MNTPGGASEFLDAERIVGSLGIGAGQHVADLGCGSGFFTIPLARAVGPTGQVAAVDVMRESLEAVHARAEGLGMNNVALVHADIEVRGSTKLADASQDLVLLKNILFQSKKKEAIIAEAARITKSGGRLVIIDWAKGKPGLGPPDELRTSADAVQTMATAAGLHMDRVLPLDEYHFGLILTT